MFRKFSVSVTALAVLSLLFIGLTPILAQQNQQQSEQIQPQGQNPEIKVDEGMLNKFISAAKEIEGIKAKYTQKLQGLNNNPNAMKLQQQAQDEVNKVLEKHQLDPETYNKIGNAITQNPELMKRVQKELVK
jgi:hypothetical protein